MAHPPPNTRAQPETDLCLMNIRLRKDSLSLTRGRATALSLPATDADGYIPAGILTVRFALVWGGTPQGVSFLDITGPWR